MIYSVFLLAGLLGARAVPDIMSWEDWKATFESTRGFQVNLHEDERRRRYEANLLKIKQQNGEYDAGLSGYRFGVNQYADLNAEEFGELVGLGGVLPRKPNEKKRTQQLFTPAVASIDWRALGGVTSVKNQGQCGSCWSFSSTGAMEGSLFAATGKLISLSEKELMDCSKSMGNHSCNGGLMDYAFEWVIKNGGIDTEADYPYEPRDGTCDTRKEKIFAASFTDYKDVPPNDVQQMLAAVSQRPVAIAIEADKEAFQLYNGGVLDKASCGTSLDHGVLVVGFTTEDDENYPNAWIVKNSWGVSWGLSGYVYISRDTRYSRSGICGVLAQPSYIIGGSVGPTPPGPTPPPAGSDAYENPYHGDCSDNEMALSIQRQGKVCAPKCTTDAECPAAPTGFNSTPRCAIEDDLTGDKFCMLECVSSFPGACGDSSSSDQSHAGAVCDYFCNSKKCLSLCMYNGSEEHKSASVEDATVQRIIKLQTA